MKRIDALPRIFQCNLDRLFQSVIKLVIEQLPIHPILETGEAPTYDAYLNRCQAQVDNYLANEAARTFALTLAATFERQLHVYALELWSSGAKARPTSKKKAPQYDELLELAAEHAKVDLAQLKLQKTLSELLTVANVVRHGEGHSCDRLVYAAPHLWAYPPESYYDLSPGPAPKSELMRVMPDDLVRYVVAGMKFWGHADPQPGAITEFPPYTLRPASVPERVEGHG